MGNLQNQMFFRGGENGREGEQSEPEEVALEDRQEKRSEYIKGG
jgi:hypothetical protein